MSEPPTGLWAVVAAAAVAVVWLDAARFLGGPARGPLLAFPIRIADFEAEAPALTSARARQDMSPEVATVQVSVWFEV